MPDSVLVVESEPSFRMELASVLSRAVFQVAGASNYLEALGKLDDFRPDLVILNEELPVVDGWEACYQLHHAFGIPVILLGEDYSDEAWVRSLEAGADFYLRMPFSHAELVTRIRAILRRYKEYKLTHRTG